MIKSEDSMDAENNENQNSNLDMSEVPEIDHLFEGQAEEQVEAQEEVKEEIEDEVKSLEDYELALDFFDPELQEEKNWQDKTGLNSDTLCGTIETLVFMSERPVSLVKLRKMIDEIIPLKVIHESIVRLQDEYEQKHHGIRLMEVAEGYQFRTKATYAKYVQDMFKVSSLVLSPSTLEVLAIIAYKQPITKSEVDRIRGVDSSHLIRALMDRRLVRITGRGEEVGRPSLFGTTQEFLEVFNLPSLSALPGESELKEIATRNEVGSIAEIKTICEGDKKRFYFDELEEIDQLADVIRDIKTDTPFTESLKIEEKKRLDHNGQPVRSAFEILEEHVNQEKVRLMNLKATESETIAPSLDVKIIEDFTQGPFNLPEVELDLESFEMVDLDTGETIQDQAAVLAEEEDGQQELEASELLFGVKNEVDAIELENALDLAFDNLTRRSEDLRADLLDESQDRETLQDLERTEGAMDEALESFVTKAESYDVDLEFLRANAPDFSELANSEDASGDSEDQDLT
jgi:segregation and condensation protein B